MLKVSNALKNVSRGQSLPSAVKDHPGEVSEELKTVAELFIELQGLRHRADYDLRSDFLPKDVKDLIDPVEYVIESWQCIRGTASVRLFLLSLLVWKRISKK